MPSASEKRKRESLPDASAIKKLKTVDAETNNTDGNAQDSGGSPASPISVNVKLTPRTVTSLSSPTIHPDRFRNFSSRKGSDSSQNKVQPLSPLSKSPERSLGGALTGDFSTSMSRHTNRERKLESMQSNSDSPKPKSLQVSTAHAMSDLDPRSPGFANRSTKQSKGMPSGDPRGSHDDSGRSSNLPSRRQSGTTPVTSISGARPSRSECSTTVLATPVVAKDPRKDVIDDATTTFSGLPPQISTPNVVAVPEARYTHNQEPIANNFEGFAQSIISSSCITMKLENMRTSVSQNLRESRRYEKYNVAYPSLLDVADANSAVINKAMAKLEKELENTRTNQALIATRLENPSFQNMNPSKPRLDAVDDCDETVLEEIAKLKDDLRLMKEELADQKEKSVRQKDFERFAQKTVNQKDLEQFSSRDDVLDLRSQLSSHTKDLKCFESKISKLTDLPALENAQAAYDQRLRGVTSETSQLRNTCSQRFESMQTKILSLREDFRAIKEDPTSHTKLAGLRQDLGSCQLDIKTLKEGHVQLQSAQASLESPVPDASEGVENKISTRVDSIETDISLFKAFIEELQGKFTSLETMREDLDTTKQELVEITGGHDILAGDFDEIRLQQQTQNEDYDRLKATVEQQQSQDVHQIRLQQQIQSEDYDRLKATVEQQQSRDQRYIQLHDSNAAQSTSAAIDATSVKLAQVKLEKLENDVQALDVFTKSQQLKFDNLTTADLANSIIHQMKQLYDGHPGHVHDKLQILEQQQRKVDNYVVHNLEPRLVSMGTQIGARASTDALQNLGVQVQTLATHVTQLRKDLPEGIANVKLSMPSKESFSSDLDEALRTLSTTLGRMNAKHTELSDIVATEHGVLHGDIKTLGRMVRANANPRLQRQISSAKGSEPERANSRGSSERVKLQAPLNGHTCLPSDDDSDTPIISVQKRKRKRQISPELGSTRMTEDENGEVGSRRAIRIESESV